MDDQFYMRRALELAAMGEGFTSPNPMVGAVVVRKGRIVGEGWHQAAGLPHAEVNALDDAGKRSRGSTLFVTLEPCHHIGRTPPCTEKILASGVSRVVMAMQDPNPGVKGGGAEFLKSKGIQVTDGVCEQEARRLNECFIKHVTTGRPFVIVKCAATLDGRIASSAGDSKWITGPDSRRFVHRLRHRLDAIMVGSSTVKIDNPALTTRWESAVTKNPLRVVLDTHLSIPEESQVLDMGVEPGVIVATGPDADDNRIASLKKKGVDIIVCPLHEEKIDLKVLLQHLGARGITGILIEGGSQVIGSAFSQGVVDRIYFFYAPKILGGSDGTPMIGGKGALRIEDCLTIKHIELHRFDDDILIEGCPDYQTWNR